MTNEVFEMGNENEIFAMYKRNSVTEWLQKTGQVADNGQVVVIKDGKDDKYRIVQLIRSALCHFISLERKYTAYRRRTEYLCRGSFAAIMRWRKRHRRFQQ